jgi:hypothetical protein
LKSEISPNLREFAYDNFRERHEAGLRVGRHGEAVLEGSHAVSSADPGAGPGFEVWVFKIFKVQFFSSLKFKL